jgi:hypothetical protein
LKVRLRYMPAKGITATSEMSGNSIRRLATLVDIFCKVRNGDEIPGF